MLKRRSLIAALLENRPEDLLVVSSLGSPSWDVCAAGDHAGNFHFIGAMGQAAPFALGLAIAQAEKRVLLVSGDGEMLMSLGVLTTIANQQPANLAIIVLDNQAYMETGGQPSATAGRTDLQAVALACGIPTSVSIDSEAQIDQLKDLAFEVPGPVFANVKIRREKLPLAMPSSFDGVTALNRFRAWIQASNLE